MILKGAGHIFTARGFANIGCLVVLAIGTIALFAGYPIISYVTQSSLSTNGAYNLGGINATGQIPDIPGFPRLIDPDTPQDVMTRTGFDGNDDWQLVYSDEFNKDGRTFYEGDDPFWQGAYIPNPQERLESDMQVSICITLVQTTLNTTTHRLQRLGMATS